MARRKTVFAKNVSEFDQQARHPLLNDQSVIPVGPMVKGLGYLEVRNGGKFLWPAGAIIQIPFQVWAINPGLGKKTWTREVTEMDFKESLRGPWLPTETEPPPPVEEETANEAPSVPEPERRRPGRPRNQA